jgi:hypothetical protein
MSADDPAAAVGTTPRLAALAGAPEGVCSRLIFMAAP